MQGVKGSNYTPRKVTQEMLDKILNDIKLGSPIKYASEAHGLSDITFHHLIKLGKQDLINEIHDTLPARLLMSLRSIQNEQVKSCALDIRGSDKGHRGAEWILEQMHWRQFGRHAQIKELSEQLDELELEKNSVALKGAESKLDELMKKEK